MLIHLLHIKMHNIFLKIILLNKLYNIVWFNNISKWIKLKLDFLAIFTIRFDKLIYFRTKFNFKIKNLNFLQM